MIKIRVKQNNSDNELPCKKCPQGYTMICRAEICTPWLKYAKRSKEERKVLSEYIKNKISAKEDEGYNGKI